MNEQYRLVLMAKESCVEVVGMEEMDRMADGSCYELHLRADILRLMGYLRMLENSGSRQVAIERVTARRESGVWDTFLEAVVYSGRTRTGQVVDASLGS